MTLRIESFEHLHSLQPYAGQWNELAFNSTQRLPMLSYAWVVSYLEHRLTPTESWRCLLAFDDEELIGVLPYVRSPHPVFGTKATILRAPADDHTICSDVLLSANNSAAILRHLLASLRKHERGQLGLKLQHVREGSPTFSSDYHLLPNTLAMLVPTRRGSFLDTRGDLGNYVSSISKNFRGNLRKANNKLTKLDGVSYEFDVASGDTDSALNKFLEIEASGWKGRESTAIACSESLTNFYKSLLDRLSECGWLEWHFLYANGEAIAAHMAVRINNSIVIPKIAHNERYAACSPGNLLFKRLIEISFESDGIDEINCLTDFPWHRRWNMSLAKYYTLWLFPYRPMSVLVGALPNKLRMLARTAASLRLF